MKKLENVELKQQLCSTKQKGEQLVLHHKLMAYKVQVIHKFMNQCSLYQTSDTRESQNILKHYKSEPI